MLISKNLYLFHYITIVLYISYIGNKKCIIHDKFMLFAQYIKLQGNILKIDYNEVAFSGSVIMHLLINEILFFIIFFLY